MNEEEWLILEHLNTINQAIIRETRGKIPFNRADQAAIRQATQDLTAKMTRLVFKIGKQEMNKLRGQHEIWKGRATKLITRHQQNTNFASMFPPLLQNVNMEQPQNITRQRTYAKC
ncbi:hypothetical protein JTB14_009358 [Gonioctena quinquepunctata]|nr:hypothetical protein JTB14_009358 [Gonioctena quinquepunctata]